jgi:hypothetical protein
MEWMTSAPLPKGEGMKRFVLTVLLLFCFASPVVADNLLSASGSLNFRGIVPWDDDGKTEYPSILARIKADAGTSTRFFHLCLEAGWDGTVDLPAQDDSILKNWSDVYQRTTPFLEFKELYAEYATMLLDIRLGVQRFSWGRLDEYPINDLLNPWDYTRFLMRPLEDRKIGVPSLSARVASAEWSAEAVWVPLFVPYRLPLPSERWAGASSFASLLDQTGAKLVMREPDLPARTPANGSFGLRLHQLGSIEWGLNLFHGYDPRPVFKAARLAVVPAGGHLYIDPGVRPDFHKITSLGVDMAAVWRDWSFRAEAAYAVGRHFNTKQEFWGYPAMVLPGIYPLNDNTIKSDTFDYGIGVDYRLFEDCLLTMQAQQTLILSRPDTIYNRKIETLAWLNLKNGFRNRKIETNLNLAYNPEHGDIMARANAWYVFTDAWKAGVTAVALSGPSQSLFGRYAENEQVEVNLVYSW